MAFAEEHPVFLTEEHPIFLTEVHPIFAKRKDALKPKDRDKKFLINMVYLRIGCALRFSKARDRRAAKML